MKFEEIFDIKENEYFDSVKGMRYSLNLDDSCRIYKFDKKVSIYLSMYLDHLASRDFNSDEFNVICTAKCSDSKKDKLISSGDVDGLWANASISLYNYNTQNYDKLDNKCIQLFNKHNSNFELLLDADHLSDEGEVKVKVNYSIYFYEERQKSFLLRKSELLQRYLILGKEIELSNHIVSERNREFSRFF